MRKKRSTMLAATDEVSATPRKLTQLDTSMAKGEC